VGTIGIAEGDRLDASNLHRQPLYRYGDRGRPKVQLAAERLRDLNPFVVVHEHPERVTADNVLGLIEPYGMILDCTDNFTTKYVLNDAAILARKTLIQASIYQYEGQILTIQPGGPCLRCLWPDAPNDGCVGSCAEVGVLGVVPGVLGALQATEAIKSILGLSECRGVITLLDLLALETRKIQLPKNPSCPLCGEHPSITEPISDVPVWAVLPGADLSRFTLVDIREQDEIEDDPLPGVLAIPMDSFRADDPRLEGPVLLVCQSGVRSHVLASRLREAGHANIFSMIDGVRGVRG
jgi:adenylyltransferase/sulfurtransferase